MIDPDLQAPACKRADALATSEKQSRPAPETGQQSHWISGIPVDMTGVRFPDQTHSNKCPVAYTYVSKLVLEPRFNQGLHHERCVPQLGPVCAVHFETIPTLKRPQQIPKRLRQDKCSFPAPHLSADHPKVVRHSLNVSSEFSTVFAFTNKHAQHVDHLIHWPDVNIPVNQIQAHKHASTHVTMGGGDRYRTPESRFCRASDRSYPPRVSHLKPVI